MGGIFWKPDDSKVTGYDSRCSYRSESKYRFQWLTPALLLIQIVPEQENPAPPPTDTYKRDALNMVISKEKIELYVATCLPRII